ncbi:MAG: helix-turn-helix domain-containing protein [Candidatus Hydrogenedentes bacterium]|nr:helix-turn-helix domain-containing protein [Candidatus Hydrogenedentota bacterium]
MSVRIPAETFAPGEYLKDELEARGWSQIDFAHIIGRDPKTVNMILSGKMRITEDTAKLLEAALDLDAQYWLNLESAYRLAIAKETKIPDRVSRRAKLYDKYPIGLMTRRGWIEKTDSLDVLEHRVLSFFQISSLDEEPRFLCAAKRRNEPQKTSIQLAWLYRTHEIVKLMPVHGFTQKKLDEALKRLKAIMKHPEEIRHIPRILADAGVRFVIVEALPGSKIDGACYWLDRNTPVIAMTVRLDRIDNFWFVLLHELRHVANGHGKQFCILDTDLLEQEQITQEEEQVNTEAEDFLIPRDQMSDFIARVKPVFSQLTIIGFANRIGIHPGIVVGRLRKKEVIPYTHYTKMLVNVRHIICSTALCDGWGTMMPVRSN